MGLGRFLSVLALWGVLLLPAYEPCAPVQPVFFSILFPQLVPPAWLVPFEQEGVFL